MIELQHVRKEFGDVVPLEDVSTTIRHGKAGFACLICKAPLIDLETDEPMGCAMLSVLRW